MDKTT